MENKVVEIPNEKIRVVTVILGTATPDERKYFHCINCGKTLFHYYSEVRIIIDGEMREVERPIDIMCGQQGCKVVYRII